jgi:hypothetical protein
MDPENFSGIIESFDDLCRRMVVLVLKSLTVGEKDAVRG